MTAYYFAARYSRHPEMRDYRDALIKALPDAVVTSRWIDQHAGTLPNSFMQGVLNSDPEACWKYGLIDMTDLDAADVVVSFTTVGGGKGGRHIEHGYAIAKGKRLAIVGPRENIFHAHPATDVYGTWDEFLAAETWRSADLSARLSAKPDPDPETCPLDCTCDEDETCGCWCEVHDCPIAECPSFKLVDSWLRDAAEKLTNARTATLRGAADALLGYAENYPEDVFPPDAIGGTAMRHAYKNAADMIRNEATGPVPDVDGHGGEVAEEDLIEMTKDGPRLLHEPGEAPS